MKALRSNCSKLFGRLLSLLRRITDSLLNSLSFPDGFGTFNDIMEALSNHSAAALNTQTLSTLRKIVGSWKSSQLFSFSASESLLSSQNSSEKNIIISNGIILLGHFCWLLKYHGSSIVEGTLTDRNNHDSAESSLFSASSSFVSEEQFRSAFEIADTDGDGIIDFKEIQEALMALSLGDLCEGSHDGDGSNGDSTLKTNMWETSPSIPASNLSYDEFLLVYGSDLSSVTSKGEFSSVEKFHSALDKLIATNHLSWSLLLTGNAFESFRLQLSRDLDFEGLFSVRPNRPSTVDNNKKFKSRWLRRLDSSTAFDNNDENSSVPASCSFSLITTLFMISSTFNKHFISIDLFQPYHPSTDVSLSDEPKDLILRSSSDFSSSTPINIVEFVRMFVQFLTVTLIVDTYDGMIIQKIKTLTEANNSKKSWTDSFDDVTIQCYFDLIILKEALATSSSSVSANHSQCLDLLKNCINKIETSLDPVMNEFILQHIKENSKLFVSSLSFVVPWIENGKPLSSLDDATDVTSSNISKSDALDGVISQLLPSFASRDVTPSYPVARFTLLPLALSTRPINMKEEYSTFPLENRPPLKGESRSKAAASEQQSNSSTSNILKWW
jgi:hypothetical protein